MFSVGVGKKCIDNMLRADIYVRFLEVVHTFLRRIYSSLPNPTADLVE